MISCRSNIIASGPQLTTPMCLSQPGKLGIQLTRRDTLDHIHHLRWCITGWTTHKQMHIVRLHCQGFDFPLVSRTNLVDQFLQPLGHITNKHPATISRNPNKVICQPIDCMCSSPGLHRDGDYSIARSSSTLCGPYPGHTSQCQRTAVPTHGGPAFLPAASGGVSSRRIS
jgi:hypothetical protein